MIHAGDLGAAHTNWCVASRLPMSRGASPLLYSLVSSFADRGGAATNHRTFGATTARSPAPDRPAVNDNLREHAKGHGPALEQRGANGLIITRDL